MVEAGFDSFAEFQCKPFYAARQGRPSLPPGRYFRMHVVGYVNGSTASGASNGSADSLSPCCFLHLGMTEPVPDHSWLSRTRSRLPLEVHEPVFAWVLSRVSRRLSS